MIDYSNAYHHGVRVCDLDSAMADIGSALGVSWCEPQDGDQHVWLPETGRTSIPLRFTYSSQGPQHIELLQGGRGSIWDGAEHPGVHHIGVWSDDVAGDTRALVEQGWIVRLAQADPEQGYGAFTYVQPPSGLLVELVSSAVRPRFERWFAGGSLG